MTFLVPVYVFYLACELVYMSVNKVHNLQKLKKYHLKQLTFLQQKQK